MESPEAEDVDHNRPAGNHAGFPTYPLTYLQIGDMPAYFSVASLFISKSCKELVIFVDNSSCSSNIKKSNSALLCKLMIAKSRESPFVNNQALLSMKRLASNEGEGESEPNNEAVSPKLSFMNLPALRHNLSRGLLSNGLFGCVTFEISWKDVNGVQYSNLLQTDTYLALEAKRLIKREFMSMQQALLFHSQSLELQAETKLSPSDRTESCEYETSGVRSAEESSPRSVLHQVPLREQQADMQTGVPVMDEPESFLLLERMRSRELYSSALQSPIASSEGVPAGSSHTRSLSALSEDTADAHVPKSLFFTDADDSLSRGSDAASTARRVSESVSAEALKDKLVIVKFNDTALPRALSHTVTADLRLLKMVESGLPGWAVFCQSYPLLCRVYQPWMRPLAYYVYFAVSVATFLIGFYDLYKNVPVLGQAFSRLLGPVYQWIGQWGVAHRLEYLASMLFLHNFQRALMAASAAAKVLLRTGSLLLQPVQAPLGALAGSLLPAWRVVEWGARVSMREAGSVGWRLGWSFMALGRLMAGSFLVLLGPLWHVCCFLWSLVAGLLLPIVRSVSALVRLPFSLLCGAFTLSFHFCAACSAALCSLLSSAVQSAGYAYRLASLARKPVSRTVQASKQVSPVASVLRELWNELFHKVFRAMRSIVNGVVLFFLACNRHRISTYRYSVAQWRYWCRQMPYASALPASGEDRLEGREDADSRRSSSEADRNDATDHLKQLRSCSAGHLSLDTGSGADDISRGTLKERRKSVAIFQA